MSQKTMKRGYIVQVNLNDGIAIVREDATLTEWILILSELPKRILENVKPHVEVSFTKDESKEQFVIATAHIEASQYRRAI